VRASFLTITSSAGVLAIASLSGCMASMQASDVVQTSPTTYSVSADFGSINGGWDRAKVEATAKATQFCKAKGQLVTLLDEQRSGILGVTPQKSTVTFTCAQGPSTVADSGWPFSCAHAHARVLSGNSL
jgi:hypothetical protein